MALNRGTWVRAISSVGITAQDARLADGAKYYNTTPGTVRSGLLYPNASGFQLVTAASGWSYGLAAVPGFVIGRAANEGAYTLNSTGTTTVTTGVAPASGLSRWDLIYIKQNDPDKGDADNNAVFGVVQGTAASSPTKPTSSVPTGAVVIAEARIYSGTTGTNNGSNTLTQTWLYTSLVGDPIPVRTTAERPASPRQGDQVMRLDLDGSGRVIETYTGAAWSAGARPPLVRVGPNALAGNATGVQAKIDSGEIQMIIFTCTTVITTDASGYWAFDYPVPFPNGVFNAIVVSGDASVGRADIHAIAGAPFTQQKNTLFGSVVNEAGIARANHTCRLNITAWGW